MSAPESYAPLAVHWSQALERLFREREPALAPFLALYDEQIHFEDPLRSVRGLEAFAEMNRRFLARARSLEVEVGDMATQGEVLFAAWRLRLALRLGPEFTLAGATRLRVRQGRIYCQRDYFDTVGSAAQALPGLGGLYRAVLARLA